MEHWILMCNALQFWSMLYNIIALSKLYKSEKLMQHNLQQRSPMILICVYSCKRLYTIWAFNVSIRPRHFCATFNSSFYDHWGYSGIFLTQNLILQTVDLSFTCVLCSRRSSMPQIFPVPQQFLQFYQPFLRFITCVGMVSKSMKTSKYILNRQDQLSALVSCLLTNTTFSITLEYNCSGGIDCSFVLCLFKKASDKWKF